jgi:hypothetical protein
VVASAANAPVSVLKVAITAGSVRAADALLGCRWARRESGGDPETVFTASALALLTLPVSYKTATRVL